MKNIILTIILLAVGAIGYGAVGPYLTINQIKAAIKDKDSEMLSENVDFPLLRQNLKDQFNAEMLVKSKTDMKGNAPGVLAVGLATKFVDSIVDSLITPSGLSKIMHGEELIKPTNGDNKDIALLSREVKTNNIPGKLNIIGSLMNTSYKKYDFPAMKIDFSSKDGEFISTVTLMPDEYLEDKSLVGNTMVKNRPYQFNFLVTDPGKNAVGFNFKFLHEPIAVVNNKEKTDPFKNSRTSFDSIKKYSVWIKNDKGEEVRLVLRRTNLTWKLTNIIFPINN